MSPVLLTIPLLLACASAAARPAFYRTLEEGTHLAADYLAFDPSEFDRGAVDGSRFRFSGQYRAGASADWALALGHSYNALDIDTGTAPAAATNGDLHTLHIAGQWRRALAGGWLQLSLAPALSASSNGLKHPDELGGEALQLWGAALYQRPADCCQWLLGGAHDYRFGESRFYPVAGLEWRRGPLRLRATYPDLSLAVELAPAWLLAVGVAPDGNEWLAYDRERERAEVFRRQAWQGAARLSYRLASGLRLGVSAGYSWDQRWRFRRVDGSAPRFRSAHSYFVGLHLGWYRRGEQ